MNKTSLGGGSFLSLLAIAFIVLKLCKVITWSWLWVLAPLWIPFAVAIIVFILIVLGMVCMRFGKMFKGL